MRVRSQKGRLLTAITLVSSLFMVIPALDTIHTSSQSISRAESLLAGDAQESWLYQGVDRGRDYLEGLERETFSFEGLSDVVSAESGQVVGFLLPETAEESFSLVRAWLERSGWSFTEGGWETCATFGKEQGEYRWIFVSCTEVGGQTRVCIQCA